MPRHALALYTTVYPAVLRFLPEWWRSVAAQDCRGFQLWIGLDGVAEAQVRERIGWDIDVEWVTAPGANGIAVRRRAMKRIAERHEAVVFVDCDDVLAADRVRCAAAQLERCDVAGCRLQVIREDGTPDGMIFGEPDPDWDSLLPRWNLLGLSNTAYRTEVLRRNLSFPDSCELLDWRLATRAWVQGFRLRFDSAVRMGYRQYGSNTARVLPPFSPRDVAAATARVLRHHEALLLSDDLPARARALLEPARADVIRFADHLRASPANLQTYTEQLNRLAPRPVWWWAVANPELSELWKR